KAVDCLAGAASGAIELGADALTRAGLYRASSVLTSRLSFPGVKSVSVVIGVKLSSRPACRYVKAGPKARAPGDKPELADPLAARGWGALLSALDAPVDETPVCCTIS